ncbi:LPXTG-motif cell wall-anchored protein/fimbrial isopeptide formation D2 family protein [Salana multivorans]|uniref:LPXTG-motif cell wall-anchored protein/fimbrial isopeptide formation D2 family protein n=1 Tax=Salana multivorans TaxID=120377 RepID=A0A3N2DBT0_9MICO|nr:SpaH/EbpB family LPXTG-anchored major pilin [Salana multivorans]ROR97152.1 LPXTG-motif cell wall-anchored protein/fimbrial isopeptide formation D2 family protein [Salana multivorans]
MTTTSRIAAITGVSALLSIAAVGVALPAFAAPGSGGTGTITVHKFEQPLSGDLGEADGSELTVPSDATALAGVGFRFCVIDDVDLSVASDWDRLKDITATVDAGGDLVVTEAPATTLTTTCGAEVLTDADGAAPSPALPADRAYVVYESTPPADAIYTMQPTLVTVPFPGNGTGDAWNYHPHLYPKNVLAGSGATKNGTIVGGKVTFDVTVPINNLGLDETTTPPSPKSYTQLQVEDQLSGALTYTGASVVLLDPDGDEVAIASPGDYTLTESGGLVTLTFASPQGLALLDANVGGSVVLTIAADASATGTTANTATITINGVGSDVEVVDPESFFSGAHVVKEAQNRGAASTVPLAGAGFTLFTRDGLTTCPADVAAAEADATLATVDTGAAPFVSAADGSTPEIVLAEGAYCVYETTVPAGYKGQTTGSLLTVSGEGASTTLVNTQMGADEGDLPGLPITGSNGRLLLTIGGTALILTALGLVLARRRREARQQS